MMQTAKKMRHAIASTIFVLVFLVAPSITHALSCAPRLFTLSEAYEAADSIIVGLITECREEISSDPWASGGSDCSFTSLEVLKESVPARDYSGVTSSSGCGLSLLVGSQYLLFLDSKNQPMRFSAPLGGDRSQLADRYLRIVQDFRNGIVDHLAEPWTFMEIDGYCSVLQSIRGNQIRFNRRTPDAPEQPKPEWSQETINGDTVYRATVPVTNPNTSLPMGDAEIIAFGNIPDNSDDDLMLSVSLLGGSTAPVRQVTLSVGNKTWSLNRIEIRLSLGGASTHTVVEYYGAGDVAEEIFAAMTKPSAISVAATLVPSNMVTVLPEIPPPDQNSVVLAPSKDAYFGPAAPNKSSARPSSTSNVRAAGTPDSVLRVESRSTQLKNVIQHFRACDARQ